ncbi:MAG: dihydroorotase [Bdellovibrionales bacterium]
MTVEFTLPKWFDLHTHLRQDELLAPIIQSQLDMGCYGVLAMPNTKPPAAKVFAADDLPYWSLEEYRDAITKAGGDRFDDFITPLYLTKDTTVSMISEGADSGVLRAVKYYPPHGTTGADFGVPMADMLEKDVFQAMSDHGIVLCIHGEQHGMRGDEYFEADTNAEDFFYREWMPRLRDSYPDLKIACEHVTTKAAVDFVLGAGANTVASVTPQHLLYTVGDLLMGLKYHLFCLPLLKFSEDRDALRHAVTSSSNTQFYAGTDSAAHTVKATECGCAAGCFTGGIAPQLYVQAFEEAGLDMASKDAQAKFERFLCHNGVEFYGLPHSEQTFTLSRVASSVSKIKTEVGDITPLPCGLNQSEIPWTIKL